MTKNLILAIVVIAVVAAGFLFVKGSSNKAVALSTLEVTTSSETPSPQGSASSSPEAMSETTVNITSSGFTPKTITINVGESVIWMNSDSAPHNVNSDPHPTHTANAFLNLETIQPGSSKTL